MPAFLNGLYNAHPLQCVDDGNFSLRACCTKKLKDVAITTRLDLKKSSRFIHTMLMMGRGLNCYKTYFTVLSETFHKLFIDCLVLLLGLCKSSLVYLLNFQYVV